MYATILHQMHLEAYCFPVSLKFVSEHRHILYGIVYEGSTCNIMRGDIVTYEFCGIHYLHTQMLS
jgi:hypothetical protein